MLNILNYMQSTVQLEKCLKSKRVALSDIAHLINILSAQHMNYTLTQKYSYAVLISTALASAISNFHAHIQKLSKEMSMQSKVKMERSSEFKTRKRNYKEKKRNDNVTIQQIYKIAAHSNQKELTVSQAIHDSNQNITPKRQGVFPENLETVLARLPDEEEAEIEQLVKNVLESDSEFKQNHINEQYFNLANEMSVARDREKTRTKRKVVQLFNRTDENINVKHHNNVDESFGNLTAKVTKNKNPRDKIVLYFDNTFQKIDKKLGNILSSCEQGCFKLKYKNIFSKLNFEHDYSAEHSNYLQQSISFYEDSQAANNALREETVKIVDQALFTRTQASFNILFGAKNGCEKKGILFFQQLLHLNYNLIQDEPSKFSDILITKPQTR